MNKDLPMKIRLVWVSFYKSIDDSRAFAISRRFTCCSAAPAHSDYVHNILYLDSIVNESQ